jgi:hypothetical protein
MMPSERKLRDNARSPAVLHGHEANEAYPMSRVDRADLERSDCRPGGEDTRSFARTVAKASCR